jgi:hypothetical protein
LGEKIEDGTISDGKCKFPVPRAYPELEAWLK